MTDIERKRALWRAARRRYLERHRTPPRPRQPRVFTVEQQIASFWQKVDKSGECWEWTGARNDAGYGVYQPARKRTTAHRYSWALHFGPIPDGLFVCHHCDNPPCVRPDHLFLGTNLDNIADKTAKGRARGGNLRGEKHPNSRLTVAQILEIRALHGTMTLREIGVRFGVSRGAVRDIVHRRRWKSVPG